MPARSRQALLPQYGAELADASTVEAPEAKFMDKKAIGLIVLIIALIIGAFLLWSRDEAPMAGVEPEGTIIEE